LAELKDGQWQAFSLEFGLAAQGDSLTEVKRKLESMIVSYVKEALGEDKQHAYQLLTRRAGWQTYAKYYLCSFTASIADRLGKSKPQFVYYREPLALEPKPA
jgi:hypothetical protein